MIYIIYVHVPVRCLNVYTVYTVFVVLVSQHLKMYSNQKNEFQCFFVMNSSFKFPTSAMSNEVDHIHCNGRLVTNDITSGISQSLMLLFCLFVDHIVSATSVCLLFVDENS